MNNAKSTALRDISQWIKDRNLKIMSNGDTWVVTAYGLDCKEQRLLNKQLGITGINKIGNTNGKKQ